VFIDHDLEVKSNVNIPDRPQPINLPKIANANIIANNDRFNKNNIVLGHTLAGNIFLPALGVSALVLMKLNRVKWMILHRTTLKN